MTECSAITFLAAVCVLVSAQPHEEFSKNASSSRTRITGGFDANKYDYPFIVAYQHLNGDHICGGSIISRGWVVTAAHCINPKVTGTRVEAGALILGEKGKEIQIVRVGRQVRHPKYIPGIESNDIGLLKLTRKLRWSKAVQPIGLPRKNEESQGYAFVVGWGYRSAVNPIPSSRLQQLPMKLLAFPVCQQLLRNLTDRNDLLVDGMMCGVGIYIRQEGICQGDSGSPIAQQRKLIGVASWNLDPCGTENAPSVFTKVAKFLGFIKKYVWYI